MGAVVRVRVFGSFVFAEVERVQSGDQQKAGLPAEIPKKMRVAHVIIHDLKCATDPLRKPEDGHHACGVGYTV